MLSFPNSPPSAFPRRSTHSRTVNGVFFCTTNSTRWRGIHALAAQFKGNQNSHGHTTARNLQVRNFLETLVTLTSSEKLEALQKNGDMRTISDFNHLLMSLVASDEFELALSLKSSLSSLGLFPDGWTYSIWVSCYFKKDDPIEAKIVLDRMLENGFDPNVATFTALINSFCRTGRLKRAFEVFDVMSTTGCEPTINTYNCLIKGLCYVGRVEEAFDMMVRIKNSSTKPDIYTYTAMMDGFCKVGRSNEAAGLLREALEIGLSPSVVTYNTLFNGYFKEGRPFCGFGLLRERDCKPNYISYSTLLHGLLKWGKTKAALDIYKRMVETGLPVDERMMNTLLRGLCRCSRKEKTLLKEAYNVFGKMMSGNYVVYADGYNLMRPIMVSGNHGGYSFWAIHEPRIGYFDIIV